MPDEPHEARKYDPSAGRWMSPDPAGWAAVDLANPQSLSRYAYVVNQAMSAIDPTGLCAYWSKWTYTFAGVTNVNWYKADTGSPCPSFGGGMGVSQVNPPSGSPFGNANATGYSGGGGAPSNSRYCSVLDPNCKKPGPAANYLTFLGCEYNITIADLTDASPASYGALAAGAVGVKQTVSFLNGVGKGVPVINQIAALYDVTMMNVEAIKSNQACTAAVYGR